MTERDREVLVAFADNNMNIAHTSRALYMHRNTVKYHLAKIKKNTGLNPYVFFELVCLLKNQNMLN